MALTLIRKGTLIGSTGSTPVADAAVLIEGDRLVMKEGEIVKGGRGQR